MHPFRSRDLPALVGGLALGLLFVPLLIHAATDETIFTTAGNADYAWGKAGATYVATISQYYVSTATDLLCGVRHKIARNGSTTDNVVLTLYQSGADPDDGLAMASTSVEGISLPTNTNTETDFNFGYCFPLAAGQTYWFTLTRSGALSDTINYTSRIQNPGSGLWAYVPVNGGWDPYSYTVALTAYGVVNLSYYTSPSSTASSSAWVLTCDPTSGAFSYSMCSVALYLFVPDPAIWDDYLDLWDQIKAKPPIGYFTSAITALSSFTTSTAPYSLGSISAFGAIFTPIRDGLDWVFWFMLVIWLVMRARHMKI